MLNKLMKRTLGKTSHLAVYYCRGVINRYGFNNEGVDAAAQRLDSVRQQGIVGPSTPKVPRGLIGVNLGKNKTSEDAGADYSIGVSKLGQFADYLVINISSPNTPGGLTLPCIDTLPANLVSERYASQAAYAMCVFPQRCIPKSGGLVSFDCAAVATNSLHYTETWQQHINLFMQPPIVYTMGTCGTFLSGSM